MVIKKYEGEKKVNMIVVNLHLSPSNASKILKDRERICKAVKGSEPKSTF